MSASKISDAEARLGVVLPPGIKGLYAAADGHFRSDGQWWVVWPLDDVIANNDAAWREQRLPRWLLAFGDDGTGDPFCVRLGTRDDEVVRWSWIDKDIQTTEGSLSQFAAAWLEA